MAISRPFDMINDLNDSKHLWKIGVRIVDLWYIQVPPKIGHLEMILMDSKGDKIQVSVRKDEFNEWSEKLKEHKTYVMHNFHVQRNDLQYKACDHAYRMQFTSGTTLKEKDLPDIPLYEYQFKNFSDILAGNFRTDLLVDIMGVVVEVIFSQPNANLKKVIFTMRDFSGDVISCTLWEDHAIKFMNYYQNKAIDTPIIILTHARIKEPQGKYPPSVSNSWHGSKLLINEDIPNIEEFKTSFHATQNCEASSQRLTQLSQYSQLSEQDKFMYKAQIKSISEINSLTSSEAITCVTVGTTVMFIIGKHGWYYEACVKCSKKATVTDGPFTCQCGQYNEKSIPRYKLDMKVIHKNGWGKFVFWDTQCVDIIGITALDLKKQMLEEGEDDPKAFPLVLDMMLARTLALKVKVQPSYNQSSVMNLSEDPQLIQAILDQIVMVEDTTSDLGKGKLEDNDSLQLETSVSVTADHDPDILQAATPAKRLSTDSEFDQEQSPHLYSTQLSSTKVAKHIKQE